MKIAIRKYSGKGAPELFNVLEQKRDEVQGIMQSIEGYVSYTVARTGDGGITITVCRDDAGIAESVKRAKEWVTANDANTGIAAPEVTTGQVI